MAQFPSTTSAYGRWGLLDIRDAIMGGNWPSPPVGDPYFNYVSMLLHGDGTPGVLPFNSDASANNFNIAINGDTKPNPFNPYQAGYYGNYFNGSSYLSVANSASLNLGSSNYTIEFFVYGTSATGARAIVSKGNTSSTGSEAWTIEYTNTSGGIAFYVGAYNGLSAALLSGTITLNVWNHVAVVRNGTAHTLYINGVSASTGTASYTVTSAGSLYVGTGWYDPTVRYSTGYVSNLRLVIGSAVYTGNFTPSTTPLTAITNTQLLTCQSNRFIDNSTNAFTITTSGSPQVSYLQPFTVPSTYDDYGAGYFDGASYLQLADSTAWDLAGDYTIEMWLFVTSTPNSPTFFQIGSSSLLWYLSAGTKYLTTTGGLSMTASTAMILNTWNHVALSRSGSSTNNTKMYLNGVKVAETTNNTSFTGDASNGLRIGAEYTSGYYLNGYASNVRVVKGTAVYTGDSFTVPTSPLTAITNTQLLTLQTNGGANDSGFVDSSPNDFVITRAGNATQGSFSPYGANWSNYFDGNGDYLNCDQALDGLTSASNPFTVECWFFSPVMPTGGDSNFQTIIGINGSTYANIVGLAIVDNKLYLHYAGASAYIPSTPVVNSGTWYHIAAVFDGTNYKVYLNGALAQTVASNPSVALSTCFLNIGMEIDPGPSYGNYFNGYISNVRVTNSAVYTSNFTPPTSPLTAISGTSLLTCQSNRFKDSSANNFTLTVNGNTSVQRFNPFGAPDTYSAATIGGSGYFDGNGDYLSVADNAALDLSTGDFTIECWAFPITGIADYDGLIGKRSQSTFSGGDWRIAYRSASTAFGIASGSNNIDRLTPAVNLNAWNHIAFVRSSGTLSCYANGVRGANLTWTENLDNAEALLIGLNVSGNDFPGYISNVRIVKGTAVYSGATYTVPTAPLTVITNTSLLLSMTNAGIYDNAMMADLETVGNAQVSTTQKKFGTGSMYFDGSGDWLAGPPTPQTDLGSGNFTIECWLYRTASGAGSDSGIVSRGAPGSLNGFVFAYTSSNVLTFNFNYSGAIVTGSTAIPINTWTHVAVTRSGTTFRLFVNGTVDATNTSSNSQTLNAGDIFYVGRSGYDSSRIVTGYIDDLRITKGYARYTANFTVPTEAFPNYWELFAPGAPTGVSATGGNAQATVSFTAPTNNGGAAITGYRATSSPGNFTATGASSPLTVTGLTNGTSYTFTVEAQNSVGYGTPSAASNSVTPVAYSGPTSVEYLVVAGGGGGAADDGGGGGAGGFLTASGFAVSPGSAITVTVGGGGTGASAPGDTDGATSGSNSTFGSVTATGGGAGHRGGAAPAKSNGGSGGGGGYSEGIGGTGVAGPPRQGYNGGNASYTEAGGGGGAGAAGQNGNDPSYSGAGGVGVQSSITGTATYYAGGGGGGGRSGGGGAGGLGGGGKGQRSGQTGTAGTANTGGGGGGCGDVGSPKNGFNGGSGIVIIRYPDTYADAASTTGSPTFTNTGGYKIYKWTSSGSITF